MNQNITNSTKGQLEADISEALIKFEKEYMGRGPEETKTYLIEDMVLIRLKGVLTPAEKQLTQTSGDTNGRFLIKQVRQELLEKAAQLAEHQGFKNVKNLSGGIDRWSQEVDPKLPRY